MIKISKGEYIARMDADDISLPERFEHQVNFMNNNPDYIVCGTFAKKFGISNRNITLKHSNKKIRQTIYFNCPFVHPTVFIRKKYIIY